MILAVGLMDDSVLYSEHFILLGDSGSYLNLLFLQAVTCLGLVCKTWLLLLQAAGLSDCSLLWSRCSDSALQVYLVSTCSSPCGGPQQVGRVGRLVLIWLNSAARKNREPFAGWLPVVGLCQFPSSASCPCLGRRWES